MDWVLGLQNAIDYIEQHLFEDIDYQEIAARSFFQLSFSACVQHFMWVHGGRVHSESQAVLSGRGTGYRKQ